MKVVAGFLGGLLLAILSAVLVTITLASGEHPSYGIVTFFLMWIVGIVVAIQAPRAGKAWRRLLIASSIISFLMPLAGLVYTGSFMAQHTTGGAQAAGAAIGGGLISGFLGFVGFFLGLVLLVIGLLVGRDKEVVYVQVPAGATPPRRTS